MNKYPSLMQKPVTDRDGLYSSLSVSVSICSTDVYSPLRFLDSNIAMEKEKVLTFSYVPFARNEILKISTILGS